MRYRVDPENRKRQPSPGPRTRSVGRAAEWKVRHPKELPPAVHYPAHLEVSPYEVMMFALSLDTTGIGVRLDFRAPAEARNFRWYCYNYRKQKQAEARRDVPYGDDTWGRTGFDVLSFMLDGTQLWIGVLPEHDWGVVKNEQQSVCVDAGASEGWGVHDNAAAGEPDSGGIQPIGRTVDQSAG